LRLTGHRRSHWRRARGAPCDRSRRGERKELLHHPGRLGTEIGKINFGACFVNDLGTVLETRMP
jgi:hypothetical protein